MSADHSDDAVLFERPAPHIGLVTLNRPAARNAVNGAFAQSLAAIVEQTEKDADIRVVILTGSGDQAFCAGADLKEVAGGRRDELFHPVFGFAGFVDSIRSKPWIASINGPALAGGFEIALACDLMIASVSARFGLPEVSRGLIASAGGLWRAPRALPKAVAAEMILASRAISAERAYELGLVSSIHQPKALRDQALRLAADVASGSPMAVQESLGVMRLAIDLDEAGLRAASSAARNRLAKTDDFKEGPRAFVERRPPVWSGH